MKSLNSYLITEENLEFVDTDFHKFMKDYKKFQQYIEDNNISLDNSVMAQIKDWIKEIESKKGLPASYHRYEQFTWALLSFDSKARKGLGGLYSDSIIKSLTETWEKATGFKPKNIYQ